MAASLPHLLLLLLLLPVATVSADDEPASPASAPSSSSPLIRQATVSTDDPTAPAVAPSPSSPVIRQATAYDDPTAPAAAPSSSSPTIRQACRATRTPDHCESSLTGALPDLPSNASSVDVVLQAIFAAIHGIRTSRFDAQKILDASASNINRTNVARTCLDLLLIAHRRLEHGSLFLDAMPVETRVFAGASQTYQIGCWYVLTKVNQTQEVVDAASFLDRNANLTGYITAMAASMQRYGAQDMSRWAPPETERDGYWPPSGAAKGGGGGRPRNFGAGTAVADATVCKGGGCDYETVQAAVDAAPPESLCPFVIHIMRGVYEEKVRVPVDKTKLVFIGDGMGKTIITGNISVDEIARVGLSTYDTATVAVVGDGFRARDLTIANTAGPDAHQAVAFRCDSDGAILESVEFIGHQDTLYAQTLRQFYSSCRITGTVDFIFGNAAAFFSRCELILVPRQLEPERGETNTVTAQGRTDPAQSTGFVFHRCAIRASKEYLALYRANKAAHKTYLGRPWKQYSRAVFIDCYMAEIIRPEGWLPWDGEFALSTLYYGEFGSSGPGANASARVPWSSQIPQEHLGAYSLKNSLQISNWNSIPELNC